jgi:hypothetical protein
LSFLSQIKRASDWHIKDFLTPIYRGMAHIAIDWPASQGGHHLSNSNQARRTLKTVQARRKVLRVISVC